MPNSLGPHGVTTRGILVPQPGIEPVPPAGEARSPDHWPARIPLQGKLGVLTTGRPGSPDSLLLMSFSSVCEEFVHLICISREILFFLPDTGN